MYVALIWVPGEQPLPEKLPSLWFIAAQYPPSVSVLNTQWRDFQQVLLPCQALLSREHRGPGRGLMREAYGQECGELDSCKIYSGGAAATRVLEGCATRCGQGSGGLYGLARMGLEK